MAPGQPTGYARSLAQLHIVGLTLDDSWESLPFTSVQFYVPDNWKAGRIWVSTLALSHCLYIDGVVFEGPP